ncbi:transfer complex protein TrsK [Leptolyngbya sp. 'hensonii']|uniref:type IV secretory system conjugative DNA transfer family protein n=1 Tax=Leptolyngbya sp. 'hensonii' TaxID=1922337 RepID=UPI00094FE42D|nr:type IV secretion system DNA-binding domain-containing protein [Leptolyngbya sp. 'hensonii']OLP17935.1 transfer complex protein TrsK [Leptolyngbya sp. 'hensonii']
MQRLFPNDYPMQALTLSLSPPTNPGPLPQILLSPSGLTLLTCLIGVGLLSSLGQPSHRKNRLATSQFAGSREKAIARQKAHRQMRDRKRNAVTFYIGKPKVKTELRSGQITAKIIRDTQTFYLPDAQRGIAVCGGPGSGKTFSVIDPCVRSVVDQGFPLILYDFKYPTQSERLAGYATQAGYEVRVFAPGFPESEVCNPLDFLRDDNDALMARQIATVLNKNFQLSAQASEDSFFSDAGDQLIEALLMLTKGMKYADMITMQGFLSLDGLTDRLLQANLNPWVRASFGQLFSVAKSEKTLSGITGTAFKVINRMVKPGIVDAFCGPSTIPLDLQGKQLLILGMDRERRDVLGPLLATVLHLIVTRNVVKRRTDPLVVALDELPTLYLPNLHQWLNENREDGLACILGFQNIVQLEKAYGKELARAVLGGCATKAIFNPQEPDSAQMFSTYLGDEEIRYHQKSRNLGSGKASYTISEQEKTRKLFEPSQFLKLRSGRCILISPAFENNQEASLPMQVTVKVPKADLEAMATSQSAWDTLKATLIHRSAQVNYTRQDIQNRYEDIDRRFPPRKGN